MRAPLILQTILGMTAIDIAAAFLIPPATMGQRLVRAKTRIKEAGIPFAIPEREDLPERLDAVLEAIYAAYAKGWGEIGETGTPQLAEEAIWLGRLVVSLLPDEPEAKGMLALMLYAEARRPARRTSDGAYVPLERQDVALWDEWQIDMAEALLHEANQAGPSGRYQIEAAIQSAHAARRVLGARQLARHRRALRSPAGADPIPRRRPQPRRGPGRDATAPPPPCPSSTPLPHDKRMADYQPYLGRPRPSARPRRPKARRPRRLHPRHRPLLRPGRTRLPEQATRSPARRLIDLCARARTGPRFSSRARTAT